MLQVFQLLQLPVWLPDASTLAITADKLLQQLTELLKVPAVQQLPGPVVICAIKACGSVALRRPHLVGKVLPAMLALASKVRGRAGLMSGTSQPGREGVQHCGGAVEPWTMLLECMTCHSSSVGAGALSQCV